MVGLFLLLLLLLLLLLFFIRKDASLFPVTFTAYKPLCFIRSALPPLWEALLLRGVLVLFPSRDEAPGRTLWAIDIREYPQGKNQEREGRSCFTHIDNTDPGSRGSAFLFIPIINLILRYFKQKAGKENKRKRKTNDSDDETSEMALNFGTVLFLLIDSRIMPLSIQDFCVLTSVDALFWQTTFKKSVLTWSSTSLGKNC